MSIKQEKWSCNHCTYVNWPSSGKCTMCKYPKLPQVIGADQDIYQLSSRSNKILTTSKVPENKLYVKWKCHHCTYLNWPKSLKCVQCSYARRQMSPTGLADKMGSLRINTNEEAQGGGGGANSPISRRGSPNSPESPRELQELENDKNRALALSQQLRKWTCLACTYENWPRSPKCVLCHTPRKGGDRTTPCSESSPEREDTPTENTRHKRGNQGEQLMGATACANTTNNYEQNKQLRRLRRRMREQDLKWLNACLGVVNGEMAPVDGYLLNGGDPARQLTQTEAALLNRPSAFDPGHTLVHLAIRFKRDEILALVLSHIDDEGRGVKRVPCAVAPDLAADIRRIVSTSIRCRKGSFPCNFFTELTTFSLPGEIEDLSVDVQEQLFEELLDRQAQKELETASPHPVINWSLEVCERLGSRLYPLWNRSAGDCLLDSLLQATWGVLDRENSLRRALAESLCECSHFFYPRWKEYEAAEARLLDFSLDEGQFAEDWAGLVRLARQPGASLEQLHIFCLAHILRRPIIVYGVKYFKSFKGEALDIVKFEGVYLPLLWERSFCWKSPVALAYTRGHFSALVAIQPDADHLLGGAGANDPKHDDALRVAFLPLLTPDGKLLPVHFLSQPEVGHEESLIREWLDVCITEGGVLVAQQHLTRPPLLVAQMLEEWLNHYRRLGQMAAAPLRPGSIIHQETAYSSDNDSE